MELGKRIDDEHGKNFDKEVQYLKYQKKNRTEKYNN